MSEKNSTDFRTVAEFYSFTQDDLEEKAALAGSPYWANCLDFYERVKNKSINALSQKEAAWLEKIEETISS